ncbi:MAG: hypothetical protein E3J72_08200 [Planctomycetota bacterium]|nr:MAG: hypothetical protein E3J72_08200 [Planctomycetota bacterium]
MKTFTGVFLALFTVMMVGGVGCASVGAFDMIPPDPVAFSPEATPVAMPLPPLAEGDEAVETEEEGEEGEEDGDEEAEDEGKLGEYPFDKVGRIEVTFDAFFREHNHKGSDSWSQEILLAPEIGIIVHEYFEALAGIGFRWLRGQEKHPYMAGAPIMPPPTGGVLPGHYRVEERYLSVGGRFNIPIPDAPLFVPFAELKLGLAWYSEWTRIYRKHDGFALRNDFALGARIFVNEERNAAVIIKYNFHHTDFSEKEVTIGERSDRELLFGMSFFF